MPLCERGWRRVVDLGRLQASGGCGFRVSLILEQRAQLLTKSVGLWVPVNCNGVKNCQIEYFLFGA
jgi:hypothetical protein